MVSFLLTHEKHVKIEIEASPEMKHFQCIAHTETRRASMSKANCAGWLMHHSAHCVYCARPRCNSRPELTLSSLSLIKAHKS